MQKHRLFSFLMACCCLFLFAQTSLAQSTAEQRTYSVQVYASTSKEPLVAATVFSRLNKMRYLSDEKGAVQLQSSPSDTLVVFTYGYAAQEIVLASIKLDPIKVFLAPLQQQLDEVVVSGRDQSRRNFSSLGQVEGVQINAGRKTERIRVQEVTFNRAVNNARQVFAKVAGLNVWESDRSGGQLNIGARGLSPNRTSNFNVRQNGYDIAADALGYPESYYTPPMEAIERIDVIRGAASLQYGTQFGGLLNFVFKRADAQQPIIASQNNSVGSFGLRHNFTEFGIYRKKWDVYTFYQYRGGNDWRPNGQFDIHTAMASLRFRPSLNTEFQLEYTLLRNLSQQPGGLTDAAFERNPRVSVRARNWFKVRWNLLNLSFTHRFSAKTRFDSRFFGHLSSREALGNLERITVADMDQNRTLLVDDYQNWGNESRFIHSFRWKESLSTLLIGTRYYRGRTDRRQGDGSASSDADFRFLNPRDLENSDYLFPSTNIAAFTEWILPLTSRLSVTPGLRFEYIDTEAEGFYRQRVLDFAGNPLVDNIITERINRERHFMLFGLGLSYEFQLNLELYTNFSRNYRGITFSDLRIANPNFVVDESLQDESGYNADLGLRGDLLNGLYIDISLFYLRYNNRIGLLLRTDEPEFVGQQREIGLPPFFTPYRYRTNVADSRTLGVESLIQMQWKQLLGWSGGFRLDSFINFSVQDGRYINTDNTAIANRQVELVSPITLRTGIESSLDAWSFSAIYSYTHQHFSDATNTRRSATAVNGIIPSYGVADVILGYGQKHWSIEAGVQNLLDARYFTRRAEGYPGPGIIPANPRNYFVRLSLSWK